MVSNREQVRQAALRYLKSPKGREMIADLALPAWLLVFLSFVQGGVGVVQVLTVYWAGSGLKTLKSALTLEALRKDRARTVQKNPESLQLLVGYGVIVGPSGHGLLLGSFKDEERLGAEWMARKATELASLYADGATRAEDEPMFELLRDDTYRWQRRRKVLEPIAEGAELWLFDVELKQDDLIPGPLDCVAALCLATDDENGYLLQIPWSVTRMAGKS